tara:strand:+ start:1669 stop:2532 length:864 start_codon:yes stop_codon:yes gene_type:complete
MKKLIYFFQFIIIYLLFIIFKILGYKNSSNFGFLIGKYIGPIFRSKNKINNIINQIDELKDKKIEKNFASNVLGNYGRVFAEYPHLKNFRNNKLDKFIKIEGEEFLKDIKNRGKKAVFISGHFNNFELMAMQIEKAGIDLVAIYRPLNNTFLNHTMEKIRINYICKKQIRKGKSGTRELIENLKKGSSVALMIDQRVTEGSKVNFFGKIATTTTIPAQLIKKYECELVPVYIERYNNYFFKMYISKPLKISKEKSIDEITIYLNNVLEKMILKNPNQWIWTHDRWKK